LETTARFYLERMRAQIDQARRRRYPKASDAPAKWLSLIAGKLMGVQARLDDAAFLRDDRTKAELLLVDINSCYDDLQILGRADTTQVASFVVSALHRWFVRTDPDCDYLFTTGIMFEVEPLYDGPPPEFFHETHRLAAEEMKSVQYRTTMPGGALGASFHIPLVTHEVGHVFMFRLERENLDAPITKLYDEGPADEIYKSWVKEIIADTICGFIAGPAGFYALYEKLRGGGDAPDEEHPHNYIRLSSLGAYIRDRYQNVFDEKEVGEACWANWPIWTEAELLDMTYQGVDRYEQARDFTDMSHQLIKAAPAIRKVALGLARKYIGDLGYSPEQMQLDLASHLESFLNAIPPFETMNDLRDRKPTELTSILNVGWFIAALAMDKLNINVAGPRKEGPMLVSLDQLILKAIELSEVRRDWNSI
jgi:hypothetical protein